MTPSRSCAPWRSPAWLIGASTSPAKRPASPRTSWTTSSDRSGYLPSRSARSSPPTWRIRNSMSLTRGRSWSQILDDRDHGSPVVQGLTGAGALFRAELLSCVKYALYIYMSLYINRVGGGSCPLSSANPQENLLKCRVSMAGFCYLKLTLDTLSGILSRMTDAAASDRSRFYSVAELAKEFSLTSQGIRFYEES